MIYHLNDYRYLFHGDDATPAVREILLLCKENPGSTLYLGGGRLDFYGEYASELRYHISNNDRSGEKTIFPLLGMKDLTIDGQGAELVFHGKLVPFLIDKSENVTLKNFTVDYSHVFFFQAEILEASENAVSLAYDPAEYTLEAGSDSISFISKEEGWRYDAPKLLVCEFSKEGVPSAYAPQYFTYFPDKSDGSFLEVMYRYIKPSIPAPGRLELRGNFGFTHTPGNIFLWTFSGRECSAIIANESKNILVRDVTVYHAPAMGFVAQLTENITLDRFHTVVKPASGRVLSVNADATHFVNCSGEVIIKDCRFLNMLDDAGNIHGTYMRVLEKLDEKTLLLGFGHPQQVGLNLYRPGDMVNLVDNMTMQPVAALEVASSVLWNPRYARVTFRDPLPEVKKGYVLENFTRMPSLTITGCETGNNRPRGFLISTRKKTVIENNTFYNMCHALHFTGDANDWFESGPVEDVLIRRNNFHNSAFTGGAVIAITPSVKEGHAPFHKNIRIEENSFRLHEPRFLAGHHVRDLVFRGNTYTEDPSLPAQEKIGEEGISLSDAESIEIELPEKL